MSTTYTNTDTTAAGQSNIDLPRSEAGLISSHWDEVVRHLVSPGVAWEWGECGLSHRLKYNLKWCGLISRAPDEKRWMTTEALWLYVIDRAGDEEHVGQDGRGQELLPVEKSDHDPQVWGNTTPDRPRRVRPDRQATLTGETVPVSTLQSGGKDFPAINKSKAKMTTPSKADRAARDPGQTRLNTVELHDLDAWDLQVPWFRANAVAVPAGGVY